MKKVYIFIIFVFVALIAIQIPAVKQFYKELFPTQQTKLIKKNITQIRDKFLAEVEKDGYTNTYIPGVQIKNTPALMYFDTNKRRLTAPEWNGAPAYVKELMNTWMQEIDSHLSGEEFFNLNFNWYLVPHELGHFVQHSQNDPLNSTNNFWASELNANKIAIEFFLREGKEKELEEFINETTKVAEYLGSPVPDGINEQDYFNENYFSIGDDPTIYGYYQFLLYALAWENRTDNDSVVVLGKS